jgi:GNAT superfamily N-acetyltransferase
MVEDEPPTAAGLRHWFESEPERAHFRAWVAEEEGEVAGVGTAGFHWSMSTPGVAWVWAGVHPEHRGRGLGSALFDRGERHLRDHGVRKLESFTVEGSEGERFLTERDYGRTRTELCQRLDLSRVDLGGIDAFIAVKEREGFRLVPLAELEDRLDEVHAVYAAASADMPADDPEDDVPFADWKRQDLSDPELSREGSFVVCEGERPVALSFLLVNRDAGFAANEMTGTLAAYRGRGLARLAKLAAIRWAAEQGLREVATGNDSENAPMLALNRSLGYEVRWRRAFFAKEA